MMIEINDARRDLDNYLKAPLDYLQGKFYLDDKQIDEHHNIRRRSKEGVNRVKIWITETPDNRFFDMFNPEDAA